MIWLTSIWKTKHAHIVNEVITSGLSPNNRKYLLPIASMIVNVNNFLNDDSIYDCYIFCCLDDTNGMRELLNIHSLLSKVSVIMGVNRYMEFVYLIPFASKHRTLYNNLQICGYSNEMPEGYKLIAKEGNNFKVSHSLYDVANINRFIGFPLYFGSIANSERVVSLYRLIIGSCIGDFYSCSIYINTENSSLYVFEVTCGAINRAYYIMARTVGNFNLIAYLLKVKVEASKK